MRRLDLLAITLVLVSSGSAYGDDDIPSTSRRGAVLEASVGPRAPEANTLFAPVIDELAARGFASRHGLAKQLEEKLSLPAEAAPASEFVKASNLVAAGYDAYIEGEYDKAIQRMEPAIAIFVAHTADARDEKIRSEHFQALVVIAASRQALGQGDAAVAGMSEVLRTFPDRPVTTMEYAPHVVKMYREAKAALTRQGTGTLIVRSDDASSVISVNERIVGSGEVTVRDLIPGTYRVYAEAGKARGRVHLVKVHPGGEAHLELAWRLEIALQSGTVNGFSFPTEAIRERDESVLAVRVARELGHDIVVVLSIREVDGVRAIVGSVYDVATGALRRRGLMTLEPTEPPESKLRLLGRYLAGDDVSDPLLRTGKDPTRTAENGSGFLNRRRIIALSVVGAGLVSAGVGGFFGVRAQGLWNDSRKDCPNNFCNDNGKAQVRRARTSANVSTVLVGAGLAAVTAGAILWLTAPDPHERERAQVELVPIASPDEVGAMVRGVF